MNATGTVRSARRGRPATVLASLLTLLLVATMFPPPAALAEAEAEAPPDVTLGPLPDPPEAVERLRAATNADDITVEAVPEALVESRIGDPIAMKLLVIGVAAADEDLVEISRSLERLGVPYDTFLAGSHELTSSVLWDEDGGHYQGIILATGQLLDSSYASAFDETEWDTLARYEAMFGVRRVANHTYPCPSPIDYGLALDCRMVAETEAADGTLTAAGREVFGDLVPSAPIEYRHTWVYLARPAAGTTPLIETADGRALASVQRSEDGRETLTLTSAARPWTTHDKLLAYGIVDWVTGGLFLGERHVNLDVQVDDLLIPSDIWDPATKTNTDDAYRLSVADYDAVLAWQAAVRARPATPGFRVEWAFNGSGGGTNPATEPLTRRVRDTRSAFNFVTHTFDHMNLDEPPIEPENYDPSLKDEYGKQGAYLRQLERNDAFARTYLGLSEAEGNYDTQTLIQPDISGLDHPLFLTEARQFGIRYLISDTSRPGGANPSPNAGFYNVHEPSILVVPRRPSNLFYNLATPAQWVSEFNHFYGPGGLLAFFDRELTYAEILDVESDMWLSYLLKWDLDPLMFHQANLADYGGGRSLLGDLLDATLDKYEARLTLPIRNLSFRRTGELMAERMAYDTSGVEATREACSLTIAVTSDATVPVTGVAHGSRTERYGGHDISYVPVSAGVPVTIPLEGDGCEGPPPEPAASVTPTAIDFGSQRVGTASSARSITVTSTGTGPLTLGATTIGGPDATAFTIETSGTCSANTTLPVGQACTIQVRFVPTDAGVRIATLRLASDAPTEPVVALAGTAIAPAANLSPTQLTFEPQAVGATSAGQRITVTNTGTAPLVVGTATFGGPAAGDYRFGAPQNCTGSVVPTGASCTMQVHFVPTTGGVRDATLSLSTDAPDSPHVVGLSGTGTVAAVRATPEILDFGTQRVRSQTARPVTITNQGTTNVTVTRIALGGTDANQFALPSKNPCVKTALAPGRSCTFDVTFKPSKTGPKIASLSITHNASTAPVVVELRGTAS